MMRRIIVIFILSIFCIPTVQSQEQNDFEILSAYRDFFNQATDFSMSFVRYKQRGLDPGLREFTWNRMPLMDWESGRISWSVAGNLSSLNINTTSSDKLITNTILNMAGFKAGVGMGNRSYMSRLSAGMTLHGTKGWSTTVDASGRWGESVSVDGVSTESYSLFAAVARESDKHFFEVSLLYAPSERTTQRASTAEAYELTGNNLYNPAWGWVHNSRRSINRNQTSQPVAIVKYMAKIRDNLHIETMIGARVGSESRTGLSWQNTPNPYPDYYRYMPSYQKDPALQDELKEAWRNDQTVTQINFQNLYDINGYNSPQAKYIIEQRRRNVEQYNLESNLTFGIFRGGFDVSWARNRNYKRVEDLMGAEYWLDVDAWVENDDDVKKPVQNNMLNPDFHAKVGDVFGYDYAMTMRRATGWIEVKKSWESFEGIFSGKLTTAEYQRTGYFEKENFWGKQSLGHSPKIFNYDHELNLKGIYKIGGHFNGAILVSHRAKSPVPSQLFLSREYRNAIVPKSIKEKISRVELSADYRSPNFKFMASLYYTALIDGTQLLTFYDDNIHQYTNYWMQKIDRRYAGLELSSEFNIYENLSGAVAVVLSDNRYVSNPSATQWVESTGELLRENETVYYENLRSSGSPQNLMVATLKYDFRRYHISLTGNYFGNSYISVSPLRRTERSTGSIAKIEQETFGNGFTLDMFAGKTFYFRNSQSLGIWVGLNNIFNDRAIKAGGYESFRTVDSAASDSRYYYALGINGFISLTYRF